MILPVSLTSLAIDTQSKQAHPAFRVPAIGQICAGLAVSKAAAGKSSAKACLCLFPSRVGLLLCFLPTRSFELEQQRRRDKRQSGTVQRNVCRARHNYPSSACGRAAREEGKGPEQGQEDRRPPVFRRDRRGKWGQEQPVGWPQKLTDPFLPFPAFLRTPWLSLLYLRVP